MEPTKQPPYPTGFEWVDDKEFAGKIQDLKPGTPERFAFPIGSVTDRATLQPFLDLLNRSQTLAELVPEIKASVAKTTGYGKLDVIEGGGGLMASQNEVVVRLPDSVPLPGTTNITELKRALLDVYRSRNPEARDSADLAVERVCPWNPRLFLLNGNQILTRIRTGGERDNHSQTRPRDGGAYPNHCVFKALDVLPEPFFPLSEETLQRLQGKRSAAGQVRVAILDTGFDFESLDVENYRLAFNNRPRFTLHPDFTGWNFVEDSNDPFDDHFVKHGSRLAAIVKEANNVTLFPLKTHDGMGIGRLFDILSALEYVLANDIHVVTASWSFYMSDFEDEKFDPQRSLLLHYLNELRDRNVLFVTAAGNAVDFPETEGTGRGIELGSGAGMVKMYPACFNEFNLSNLIVVTSFGQDPAEEGLLKPRENFSGTLVDAGIDCGNEAGDFENPISEPEWKRINDRTLRSYTASPTSTDNLFRLVRDFLNHRADVQNDRVKGSSYAVAHFVKLLVKVLPKIWEDLDTEYAQRVEALPIGGDGTVLADGDEPPPKDNELKKRIFRKLRGKRQPDAGVETGCVARGVYRLA